MQQQRGGGGGGGEGVSRELRRQQHQQLSFRSNVDANNSSGIERVVSGSSVKGGGTRSISSRSGARPTVKQADRLMPSSTVARGGTGDDGGGGGGGMHDRDPGSGLSGGSRYRRLTSDISKGASDHASPDRRISNVGGRDPLHRSRDASLSDAQGIVVERGGHGRDGPTLLRESTAGGVNGVGGGGGHGGTDRERGASRVGAGGERERSAVLRGGGGGVGLGEEELPMEVPGRYERMRVLGRGSFGAVTLVKDHRDSKLYAMKTLNCADKIEERETAMEEVRLLRGLKHPCILTLFDTFLSADGRLVCLTTTYCESGDLAKIIKHAAKTKCQLGEKTVLGWFAQLCLSVHYLHEEKRVLHRDIKPNNVFLMDSKKIVQLGDFGLAKVINEGDKQVKAEVGTPYYTSPEMCNNQPYGFPSDVWSLGIVLFELLALDVPFRSRDVVALVSQVIKAPPPPLPDMYSQETTALTRWLLQKDPQRRPTLAQVLACQPLRRHMNSFVKHYRPMNMAERQRRHDIKDLEHQVAAILERGGDDPQIPGNINEGCGTLPPCPDGAGDASMLHGMSVDAKKPMLDAPGGVDGAAEGAVGTMLARAATADSAETGRNLSIGTPNISLSADPDGKGGGGGQGACARCGARVSCACGAGGGGGNTTPGGRRFGSPQPSKGARSVMSWGTPGVDKDDADDADARRRDSARRRSPRFSDDDGSDEGRGSRRRSVGGSYGSEGGTASSDGRRSASERRPYLRRRQPSGARGSSSEESLHSREQNSRVGTGASEKSAHRHVVEGNRIGGRGTSRKVGDARVDRSRSAGNDELGDMDSTAYKRSGSIDDGQAIVAAREAARRPSSPCSPRLNLTTRPSRTSGSSTVAAVDFNRDEGNTCQKETFTSGSVTGDSENEFSIAQSGGQAYRDRHRHGSATVVPITSQPNSARRHPDLGRGKAASRTENANDRVSVRGESMPTSQHLRLALSVDRKIVCHDDREVPDVGEGLSIVRLRHSGDKNSPSQRSAATITTTAEEGRTATLVVQRKCTAQTPRSPCMSDVTSKTAKRLSEALTFAAGGSGCVETIEPTSADGATVSALSCVAGRTRRSPRESGRSLSQDSSLVPAAMAVGAANAPTSQRSQAQALGSENPAHAGFIRQCSSMVDAEERAAGAAGGAPD